MDYRFRFIFLCFCLAFCLSFFGQYHYIIDLISCFYQQFAIGALVFSAHYLYRKHYKYLFVAVTILIISTIKLSVSYPQMEKFAARNPPFKILQFNINLRNPRVEDIVLWIKAQQIDAQLLVFQEVTEAGAKELENLNVEYKHYKSFPQEDSFGSMIMSKIPFKTIQRKPVPGSLVDYTEIELENGTKIYELHTLPPVNSNYASDRNLSLQAIAKIIAADPAKNKILVGDFNITPYSHWFSELEKDSNLKNTSLNPVPTWPSLPASVFRIPIDQMLISKNLHVTEKYSGPDLGSDHLPVVTTLAID